MTATLFFLILSTTPAQSHSQEELIALIRQGNENSRAAIRSIHARYEMTQTAVIRDPSGKTSEPIIIKFEWWQDGDRVRWTEEKAVGPIEDEIPARRRGTVRGKRTAVVIKKDGAIVDGELRIVNNQYRLDGSQVGDTHILTYTRDQMLTGDLWKNALFIVLDKPRSGLYDLLANPSCVRKLEKVSEGTETNYHLVIQAPKPRDDHELELTVEPSKNYLVSSWKVNTSSPKAVERLEEKVLAFREIVEGIFFPMEIETRVCAIKHDGPDVFTQIIRLKFSLVEINQDSTSYPFQLSIPAGMTVVDHRNGTAYLATKDGKPTVVGPAPKEVPAAQLPTYDEPQQSSLFVPIAAACVASALLLAGESTTHAANAPRHFKASCRIDTHKHARSTAIGMKNLTSFPRMCRMRLQCRSSQTARASLW